MRRSKRLSSMVALFVFLAGGGAARSAETDAVSPGAEVFAIHGSNTIGARLMPAIVEAFAGSIGASAVTSVGSQPEEVEIKLHSAAGAPLATIGVHSHGSGTAVPGLISGKARLGMLSRALDDKEVEALKAAGIGDLRATPNEHVLALDLERSGRHGVGAHAGGPGGSDQGTDARTDDQVRHQATLLQRPEHPDMGKAFQASPTQHQGKLGDLLHGTAPAVLHSSSLQWGCHVHFRC